MKVELKQKRRLGEQGWSDFWGPFGKKEGGFSAKVIFTEVVQSQISFLSALGSILHFLQAKPKVSFKAHQHLRSCAAAAPLKLPVILPHAINTLFLLFFVNS